MPRMTSEKKRLTLRIQSWVYKVVWDEHGTSDATSGSLGRRKSAEEREDKMRDDAVRLKRVDNKDGSWERKYGRGLKVGVSSAG